MEHSRKTSIKYRIIAAFFVVLLPIAIFMGVYVSNIIAGLNKQIAESNEATLNLFCTSLENEMAHAESFLVDIVLNNTSFGALEMNLNTVDAYLAEYEMKNSFTSILNADSDISCLLVYSSPNDLCFSEFGSIVANSAVERAALKKEIKRKVVSLLMSGPLDSDRWFAMKINNRQFWVRAVRYNSSYCVCLIDLDQLVSMRTSNYDLNNPIALLYDGKLLAQSIHMDGNGIEWKQNHAGYYLTGGFEKQYLVIQQPIGKLVVAYLLPYKGSLRNLSIFQILFIAFSLLVVLAIPGIWLYLRGSFMSPLDELVKTMERIKKGDLKAQPDAVYKSLEFEQVNETFSSMISEITKLKISTYEKQLLAERSELARLKMQIKPHFFLNCLKNIYALAEMKRTKDIQNTILKLSNHLRYVFSSDSDTVLLEKELQLCQNYIELQKISQSVPIEYQLNVDASLMQIPVPPVSLLTLVENCIKHGVCENKSLIISISVRQLMLEGGNLVNVTVGDNGPGFPEEKLAGLNQSIEDIESQMHVGLSNTMRRFKFLFGNEFAAAFTNKGGAKIELFIPITNMKGKENTNETADC